MKYYAVIDTNVLVSYLLTHNAGSPIVKIVDAILSGKLKPMYSDMILDEYDNVLRREKFGFSQDKVAETIELIKNNGINCTRKTVADIFPVPDDIVFYEVAMSREDSYLVTGNLKHFPKNGRVVSPADMLYIIEYGEKGTRVLNETASSYYLPVSLEEINEVIREYRQTI